MANSELLWFKVWDSLSSIKNKITGYRSLNNWINHKANTAA